MARPRRLLEPENTEELLRGWFLHAHKSRTRHDEAARKYESWRYRLGIPTMTLSAIVGSSVLRLWATSQERATS